MTALELVLALVIVLLSGLASAVPVGAWSRTREPRFLLVAAACLFLLAAGIVWTYGALPIDPPDFARSSAPTLALVALAAMCLLGTGLIGRRR